MADQTTGSPLPQDALGPNLARMLMTMAPGAVAAQPMGAAAPSLSPIGPTDPFSDPAIQQAMGQQMKMGVQETPVQLQRMRAIGGTPPGMGTPDPNSIQGQMAQLAAIKPPYTGYAPWSGMQAPTSPGSFFHDLGNALRSLSMMTGPGAQVEQMRVGASQRAYGAQAGPIAARIQDLLAQQKTEEEPIAPLMSGPSRAYSAAASGTRAEAAMIRAQSYQKRVDDQNNEFLQTIDLNRIKTDETYRKDLAQEWQRRQDELGRNIRATDRNATDEDIAQVMSNSRQSIANLGAAKDPSVMGWIKTELLGMPTPQLPGGQAPQQTPIGGAPGAGAAPAGGAAGEPARPKGVPTDATWNPQAKQWQRKK